MNISSLFNSFLGQHNLIFHPETISQLNLTCRNANCRDPNKGFKSSTRKRNLTRRNVERFLEEGQSVLRIDCLKSKSGPSGETPRIVIQIDKSLLRGRCMYNRGRMPQGNEAISTDNRRESTNMQEGGEEVNINRNLWKRIADLWIFGMVECHKQPDGSSKSKEVRLYHVERRGANTLLPIIRDNVTPRSVV
ncbi:hypothetical protein HZS_1248 [Henneguya salminicola]|nr:hypothetical protein HZS_1248 [Henneguya salminicola]